MTGSEKWGEWVWCLSTIWLMGDGSCVTHAMVRFWLWDGLWVVGDEWGLQVDVWLLVGC